MQEEQVPRLVLIRGIPGSGKSTLAQSMSEQYGYIHLEADMQFELDGEYVFERSRIAEVHKWCLDQTKTYLDKGLDVVVSNTFTQAWEMKPYIELIDHDAISIIECTGKFKSIHGIPDETLEHMKIRFQNKEELFRNTGIRYMDYSYNRGEECV